MALPRQVQKQLDEVEKFEKAMSAPVEETDEPKQAAQPVEAVVEPAVVEPSKQDEQPEDDFRQKYNTLKGKYDAEVPRLHSQMRELTDTVQALKDAAAEAANAEPVAVERTSLVTDADKDAFGEDLLDVQRRVAQEVGAGYEQQLAEQASQIAELTKLVQQTGTQVGDLTFEQKLVQVVPDFAAVNADPRWVAWLDEVDPIIRGPRRNVAQQAFAAADVDAISAYVGMFKQSIATAEDTTRQTEFNRQVTPNRNTAVVTPQGEAMKPMYTQASMDAAWAKVRALNTQHKYDEANKLEAEISAALMENRLR